MRALRICLASLLFLGGTLGFTQTPEQPVSVYAYAIGQVGDGLMLTDVVEVLSTDGNEAIVQKIAQVQPAAARLRAVEVVRFPDRDEAIADRAHLRSKHEQRGTKLVPEAGR